MLKMSSNETRKGSHIGHCPCTRKVWSHNSVGDLNMCNVEPDVVDACTGKVGLDVPYASIGGSSGEESGQDLHPCYRCDYGICEYPQDHSQ